MGIINNCYIDDNNIAITDSNTVWTYTTNAVDWCCYPYESHKHFNCKRCGAPNQIDVCEYCGCAVEE